MSNLITPRTLSGFRDFLPEAMMPREQLIDIAKSVYRSFGFAPIDTPTLELLEILSGKGSEETDRQMYRFQTPGGKEVGMRFDLTVPLARFAAQHANELGLPFKRYHIATVWRGERAQRGRYREFMQCDFDTIGTTSITADTETAIVIHELMSSIGFSEFVIRINNRKILNGLLESTGLLEKSVLVLRALDKLAKIGREKVIAELIESAGATPEQSEQLLALTQLTGTNEEILEQLPSLIGQSEVGLTGISELKRVIQGTKSSGVPAERVQVDVSIARGLDYYTGTIFETFLTDLPDIGSVCSGGRYDNLAGMYTKQELPGIGASLGLDRLLAAMAELGMLRDEKTPAPVLLVFFDQDHEQDYLRIASQLRRAGVGVEMYPEPKKIGQQLKYANRKGFRCAIIAGGQEFEQNQVQVKDLVSGESLTVPLSSNCNEIIESVRTLAVPSASS